MDSSSLYIDKIDNVNLRIKGEISQLLELKEFSSFYAPNYKYHPRFKARIWNGKISYFNMKDKTLPIGLMPELLKFCQQFGYDPKMQFDINELVPPKKDEEHFNKFYDIIFKDTEFYPRDYQHEAIMAGINNRRGLILSPTGSGKSLIIYTLIRYLLNEGKKVMLVVPNVSLVNQMFSDFVDYGWYQCGHHVEKLYSGQKPTFGKDVLITTYQSLLRKGPEFFAPYDALMNDEAHSVKSVELQKIAAKCGNASTRIGLTGTLPKEESDAYNIHGMLGPTIYKLKSKKLIDKGVLSNIAIVNAFLKYPDKIAEKGRRRKYHDEVDLIESTECRMNAFKYVFDNIKDGQNSLILVNHIKHLEAIEDFIESNIDDKYQLYVINGSIDATKREAIRQTIDKESNVILLATYGTVSTGINIKRIHNVIFGSSSKSEIRVLQSIGRGLRTHGEKEGVVIWDFVDDFSYENRNGNIIKNHVYGHWEQRYKYYKEQEFPCFKKEIKL